MHGKVWVTQIQYMNDSVEYEHGMYLASELVQPLLSDTDTKIAEISKAMAINLNIEVNGELSKENRSWPRYMVMSLTEDGDLLSQWRGYCHEGGYSVGFNVDELCKNLQKYKLYLGKCVYKKEEKQACVQGIIAKYIEKYSGTIELTPQDKNDINISFIREVRLLAAYFKHESFAEENEWRLVGTVSADAPFAKLRTRGNMLIPYAELDVEFKKNVVSVTTSPGVDLKKAREAIRFFGYQIEGKPLDVPVNMSKSTLVS